MLKKIVVLVLTFTLLAGFNFLPAQATDGDKLQRILEVLNLPSERIGNIGGKHVLLKARLDRGQLVYGLPIDIPNNDWKSAETSWEKDNDISLGYTGNQEPRYLGLTWNGIDLFSNDWFPNDAPNQIAPAQRDMIKKPWNQNYCQPQDPDAISDYTWGVIQKTLQSYHKRIGFEADENIFTNNPVFQGDFGKVRDYFKVLAEPKPGLAGAVRHWHNRDGGVYYDTVTVRWDIIPDFIIESIDPGTQKAEAGKTYTCKVLLKARPDTSFLSDPLTSQLFDAMGYKQEITQDYTVPFGVAVNGQLVPIKNLQAIPGMNNIYQYNIKAGKAEDTLEVTFDWIAGAGTINIAAGVNTILQVLPVDAQNYMDWSEIVNVNNVKSVEVQNDSVNLVAVSIDPGVQGEAEPGGEYTAAVTFKNQSSMALTGVPVGGFNREYRAVLRDATGNEVQYADFSSGEEKMFYFTYHTPDAGTSTVSGIIDAPPLEDKVKEFDEKDNTVSIDVSVRETTEPLHGDPRMRLRAVTQDGEVVRPDGTAKWTDYVTATLTVPAPSPPKGELDWWEISYASITYPRKNDEFTFGCPYPPQGTVKKAMDIPGQGLEGTKQAVIQFQEDWAMDGAQIYCWPEETMMAEYPKNYSITVNYEVTYQYSYIVCNGNSCWRVTKTASYSDNATGSLLVNGTAVDSLAE